MKEKFNEKVIPVILKFINTKAIQSIKNGMVTSMSPLIIGSIFLILSNFPIKAVVDVLESTGIKPVLDQVCGATFSISALIAVIGISYSYAKLENQEPLNCGIISLATFLILMPSSITTEGGEVVSIIVGLIVPPIYCWFLKKNIRIKMPAGVPEGVTNAFSALIPAFVILTGAAVIHGICSIGFDTTGIEIIYKVVQTPLQKMTDSLGGAVLMCFTGPFLWFFGVHGSTVVGGIMTGLLQANSLANQAIIDSGVELTIANGGHIVTQQFYDQFINITGAGITIGLVMYMFFFAKSKQLKALGKLGIIPALFGINEPSPVWCSSRYESNACNSVYWNACDRMFNPVFCTVYRNLPIIWSNTDPMDLSTDYLRIPFSRMEKCFTSVSDPLCFILCLSAIH